MRIKVDADMGPAGAPAPRRLYFGAREVAVAERIDRWDGEGCRYYKLMGEDGCLYIVRLDEPPDREGGQMHQYAWRLVMFRTQGVGGPAKRFDA